jgi:hypothetical protein
MCKKAVSCIERLVYAERLRRVCLMVLTVAGAADSAANANAVTTACGTRTTPSTRERIIAA